MLIKSFSTVNCSEARAAITKQQTIFEQLFSYLSDNIFLKLIFRLKLGEFFFFFFYLRFLSGTRASILVKKISV